MENWNLESVKSPPVATTGVQDIQQENTTPLPALLQMHEQYSNAKGNKVFTALAELKVVSAERRLDGELSKLDGESACGK